MKIVKKSIANIWKMLLYNVVCISIEIVERNLSESFPTIELSKLRAYLERLTKYQARLADWVSESGTKINFSESLLLAALAKVHGKFQAHLIFWTLFREKIKIFLIFLQCVVLWDYMFEV